MLISPVLLFASRLQGSVQLSPDPASLIASYTALATDAPAARVELRGGVVIIDGIQLAQPKFSNTGVTWNESTPSGPFSGMLRLVAHGTMLSGFVSAGADGAASARPILLAADALQFTSEICKAPAQSPQVWVPGPPLNIAISFDAGLPVATASIGDFPASIGVLSSQHNSIHAQVSLDDWVTDAASFPVPEASDISIAFDGSSFTGMMTPWTSDEKPSTDTFGWRSTGEGTTAQLWASSAKSAVMAVVVTDPALSIADLVSIDTDGTANIAKQKFQDFIVYGMNDDWRAKLTSAPKPVLTPEEIAVFNLDADYYSGKLCNPFLLQLLSKVGSDQGGPTSTMSDAEKLRLRYFWESGLAKMDGYNNQSNRITQLAFETIAPRIRLYVNDTSTNWGQSLYAALTTDAAMNAAVLAFIGDGWKTTFIDRQSELLLAIAPAMDQKIGGANNPQPCTLATLYHSKVMTKLAHYLSLKGGLANADAEDDLKAWMPNWLTQLQTALAAGLTDPKLDPVKRALYLKVQANIATAQQAAGGMTALANQISTGIIAANGTSMLGKISNWLKSSKLGAGLNKVVACGAYAFALYQVINAFKGWNSLTAEQKAQTVVSTVILSVDMIAEVGDLLVEQIIPKLVSPELSATFNETISTELFDNLDLGHDFFSDTTERMAEELAAPEAEATELAFSKMITRGTIFMKGFAVLAAAAAVAFSTYKLYEDFDGDSSTIDKVLDSLSLAADALLLASSVAAVTVSECVLASLGPVGIVAGLVLALVVAFLPRKPPTPPADDYMNQVGSGVLRALPDPSADWVARHPGTSPLSGAAA